MAQREGGLRGEAPQQAVNGGERRAKRPWSWFHTVKHLVVRRTSHTLTRCSVGISLAAALGACQPTRESVTAGQIGCPPDEVATSEVGSSSGWNQSAESWIAECRGRRFVCSQVTTSSVDIGWLWTDATDSVDSDVTCREELTPVEAVAATPAKPTASTPATTPPPSGGAGFELGSSRAAARERCEGARQRWDEDNSEDATCSGAATALGFPAHVRLTFCKGGLCGIAVSHVPDAHWMRQFTDLRTTLEAKYGAPSQRRGRVPSMCRTDEQFDSCARDGTLRLSFSWQWPTGQRVRLSLGKPPSHTGESQVLLTYVQTPRAALNTAAF